MLAVTINLYNYKEIYTYGTNYVGPYFYNSGSNPIGYSDGHFEASNLYYFAGSGLTGAQSWQIRMEKDVRLTVVVKIP